MKIQVDSNRLAKACALATKNIPSKTTLPIIKCLHVVAEGDMLHVSSTDTESWVVYDVPAVVELDDTPKAFCIDASNLTNLLQAIPSQPITIALFENKYCQDKTYYAKITHSCGTSELPVVSAEEFPTLQPITTEGHCVQADVLKKSIQTCRFALFNDAEAKPQMAALCLHFKGSSMVAVATDGHRMTRLEHPDVEGEACQYLLPKKALGLLLPALDDVLKDKDAIDAVILRKDDYNVCIQTATATIYFRQIVQKYPNYDSVIPARNRMQYEAVMNRSDLIAAISRSMLFTDAATLKLVFKFDFGGYMYVNGECVDFSTSSEEKVACEFKGSAPLSIAFRSTLLKEILLNMESEQVRFLMIDQTRQTLILEEGGNENLTMMLMPMFI